MKQARPRTWEDAVRTIMTWDWTKDVRQIDLLRGMTDDDLHVIRFSLGARFFELLGDWEDDDALLVASNNDLEKAAVNLLKALRNDLVATATSEDMARSLDVRREWARRREMARQEEMNKIAAKDAKITSRGCPHCGKPCPKYRETCKHCGSKVGREPT